MCPFTPTVQHIVRYRFIDLAKRVTVYMSYSRSSLRGKLLVTLRDLVTSDKSKIGKSIDTAGIKKMAKFEHLLKKRRNSSDSVYTDVNVSIAASKSKTSEC